MAIDVRQVILSAFNQIWAEDHEEPPPALDDDTVLLETGMDSMSFAVLVAQLADELGIDPFSMDNIAVYPETFGDFVAFYASHLPTA